VVYAKPPFSGPEAVLAYLSRYTHRVAISNQRLIGFDETGVTFRYKDCRHRVPEPDRVWGVQRRALVLAANELVMNALFHAFQGRRRGQLSSSFAAMIPGTHVSRCSTTASVTMATGLHRNAGLPVAWRTCLRPPSSIAEAIAVGRLPRSTFP
jgi:hypothetical protein